jgi:hypothetical protein
MEKQGVDSLLLQSLVSTTSIESLAKGYILNCKTEGKSPKTISVTPPGSYEFGGGYSIDNIERLGLGYLQTESC